MVSALWLKHRRGKLVVYLLAIAACALLYVTLSRVTGRFLEADLKRYDLNGDDSFPSPN